MNVSAVAAACSLVALLAGCGDGGDSGSISATEASSTGDSATTAVVTTTTLPSTGDNSSTTDNSGTGTSDPTATGSTSVDPTTGATDPTATGTSTTDTSTTGAELCGNSVVDPGEACDDGVNDGAYDGCAVDCAAPGPSCGDAEVNGPEACDDGNDIDDDECTNYSSFPATAPTRQLTSKLHGRNRWVFSRPARGPPTASPRPCPPGLEKAGRRARAWKPGDSFLAA